MNSGLTIIIITVILALFFDFINGFHDTANAIATAVSTKALRPRHAILLAAIMNFLGSVIFTGVAKTIAKNIVDPYSIKFGAYVILAALLGAIFWNLLTWYLGIPSSSSHALIGSLIGAVIADAGFSGLNYGGVFSIFESLIGSAVVAFIVGYIFFTILKFIFKNRNLAKTNKGFRTVQVFTAAVQAFSHGTNDAQKSMGIITLALFSGGFRTTMDIPFWVQFLCSLAMALGTSIGGWRIIKTVGTQIMKIRPVNGVAADLSSAFIILGATHLGLPVSTTHVISSSIMGVGTAYRPKGVKWDTAQKIVIAWFITIPIVACMSAIIFSIMKLFL